MSQLLLFLAVTGASVLVAAISVIILAAGGHGWNWSVISMIAVVLGPLGVVAWLRRNSTAGRKVAVAVIALNTTADLLLVFLSLREGLEYLESTWSHSAVFVLVWAALWIAVQSVPLLALVTMHTRRAPN